ncbi:hypothetical protein ACP4OV_018929 [Aristida adscensionis]
MSYYNQQPEPVTAYLGLVFPPPSEAAYPPPPATAPPPPPPGYPTMNPPPAQVVAAPQAQSRGDKAFWEGWLRGPLLLLPPGHVLLRPAKANQHRAMVVNPA